MPDSKTPAGPQLRIPFTQPLAAQEPRPLEASISDG